MESPVDETSLTYLALQSSFRIISDDIKLIRTESKEVEILSTVVMTISPVRVAEYEIINMLQ